MVTHMANLSDQNIALATGPVHLRSGGK